MKLEIAIKQNLYTPKNRIGEREGGNGKSFQKRNKF